MRQVNFSLLTKVLVCFLWSGFYGHLLLGSVIYIPRLHVQKVTSTAVKRKTSEL